MGGLRRIINSNSQEGLRATSYIIQPSVERRSGCDAIILQGGAAVKVVLFEAKLPAQTDALQQICGVSQNNEG